MAEKNAAAIKTQFRKPFGFLAFSCAAAPFFALAGGLSGLAGADRCLWIPFVSCAVSSLLLAFPPSGGKWILALGAFLTLAASAAVAGAGIYGLFFALPAAVMAMMMLSRRNTRPGEEWSEGLWILGIAGAPVTVLLERMLSLDQSTFSAGGRTWVYLLYLLLFLFHLNRENLESSSHADLTGREVPLKVRAKNKAAVAILFFAGAAAVFSTGIGEFLDRTWKALARLFYAFIRFLSSLFALSPVREGAPSGGAGAFPGEIASAEPSRLMVFLEKVLRWVAMAAVLALLVLACRFLWKRIRTLWKLLCLKLAEMARGASEDYVDEVTDTRDSREEKVPSAPGRNRWRRERKPENSREEVRWMYRKYLRDHPVKQGLTCREALKDERDFSGFEALYETARYSDHPVPGKALEQFRKRQREKGL